MAIANYVIRRRMCYAWRRIWRGHSMQIPLATTDPATARRFAVAATAAASVGWSLLDAGRTTLHDAKQEILNAVARERLAMDYEAAGGDPDYSRPGGRAFFFFFDPPTDSPDDEPEPPKKPRNYQPASDEARAADRPEKPLRPPVSVGLVSAPATPAPSAPLPPRTATPPRAKPFSGSSPLI